MSFDRMSHRGLSRMKDANTVWSSTSCVSDTVANSVHATFVNSRSIACEQNWHEFNVYVGYVDELRT
jgi:hypothetical protein